MHTYTLSELDEDDNIIIGQSFIKSRSVTIYRLSLAFSLEVYYNKIVLPI